MSAGTPTLAARFAEHVTGKGGLRGGDTLLVALSGGVDSVALLHLLRFTPGLPPVSLVAAHVDHAMRPDSAGDAAWVAGLCKAWGVPAEIRRLVVAPATETEARTARYAVLEEVRGNRGADWVLTAHHADDQAETVLFRALRGTGLGGLRGIGKRRAPAVWRPLLPFTRDDIVAYAREVGLSWREDPTNAEGFARNVLRHQVLPLVESTMAPGARRALRGLARRARDEEAAWRSLEAELFARVDVREEPRGHSLDRDACLALHPAVRARVIRALVRRSGGSLHDAGTRLAVEFTSSGSSGGRLSLGGGVWLRRDLGRLRVVRDEVPRADCPVTLPAPGAGRGTACLAGVSYEVVWDVVGSEVDETRAHVESFAAGSLAFPLTVRGWRPGDRIRLGYGSKKLKKLFLEARVPTEDRLRLPVVVDADGTVLWVPGVARSIHAPPAGEGTRIHIHIIHAESD